MQVENKKLNISGYSVKLLVRVLTIKYMYFVSRWVIDDLPVLVTCQSGTSAMLSCEVNSPAVHGQYGHNFFGPIPTYGVVLYAMIMFKTNANEVYSFSNLYTVWANYRHSIIICLQLIPSEYYTCRYGI